MIGYGNCLTGLLATTTSVAFNTVAITSCRWLNVAVLISKSVVGLSVSELSACIFSKLKITSIIHLRFSMPQIRLRQWHVISLHYITLRFRPQIVPVASCVLRLSYFDGLLVSLGSEIIVFDKPLSFCISSFNMYFGNHYTTTRNSIKSVWFCKAQLIAIVLVTLYHFCKFATFNDINGVLLYVV